MTVGRTKAAAPLAAVGAIGLVALFIGAHMLRATPVGGTWSGAARGLTSQLATTAPAAALVLAAAATNVTLGAAVIRALRGRAFSSLSDAVVHGLAGAVALDVAALGVLGPIGLLRLPVVAALLAAGLVVVARRSLPLVDGRVLPHMPRAYVWPAGALVAVIWVAPVVVQLASPLPAIQDVLPNHVAPVEYIRQYGTFSRLNISPAPNYGPSRQLIGYVATLGILVTVTHLRAALGESAFVLPLTAVFAVASARFARRVVGPSAAYWILLAIPLTFSFLRLPDSRGTVLAAPLVLLALAPDEDVAPRRRAAVSGVVLASIVYVHPLLGALTLATFAALSLYRRGGAGLDLAAAPIAVVACVPQILTMAGLSLPTWTILPALGMAGVLVWSAPVGHPSRVLPFAVGTGAVAALLVLFRAPDVVDRLAGKGAELAHAYPLLAVGFVAGLLTARRARTVLVTAVVIGIVVGAAATFLPGNSVLWRGIADEVTGKTLQYWSPLFLATGAAAAVDRIWAWTRRDTWTVPTAAAVAAIVAVAALPVRIGPPDPLAEHEHRLAEHIGIALNRAERGAFIYWPDWRRLLDRPRHALVAAVQREQDAGRLGPRDRLLHIAGGYESWVATPIAVFTGAIETSITPDPDQSPHAYGGRLLAMASLENELGKRYAYVVLEPESLADASAIGSRIVGLGYRRVYAGMQGTLYRRT